MLLFCSSLNLAAQRSLLGTWQMESDSSRSIKIITPTNWIVFTEALNGDKKEFTRSHGGSYTLNGNKYVENIEVASWNDYGKEKTDYTVRVEGDRLFQKGNLTLADGTVMPIDEVWHKVKSDYAYNDHPGVGVWDQLSSTYTTADGKTESHTSPTVTRHQVVTPTHWLRISHRDNKFESAMGGTYTAEGNKIYPNVHFASFPINKQERIEISQWLEGGKLHCVGKVKDAQGNQTLHFEDVFQKAGANKTAKASTKK